MKPEESLGNKNALLPYKQACMRYIRSIMTLKGLTYDELVSNLAERGIHLTSTNLRSKLSKGSMSCDLLLAILDSMDAEPDALGQILSQVQSEN